METPETNSLLMRCRYFCVTFDVTTMMAGKNQVALAVCAQTIVIFPFRVFGHHGLPLLCMGSAHTSEHKQTGNGSAKGGAVRQGPL